MKALGMALLLLTVAVVAVARPDEVQGGVSCHNVNAKGVGQDLGGGRTRASIIGGGLLHGTTEAVFIITGLSGTQASFEGTIVFTVNKATLTAGLIGTFDVASGAFSATTSSIAGTGKLAGATGSLVLEGLQNLSDGSFTETVTGQICVDLSP